MRVEIGEDNTAGTTVLDFTCMVGLQCDAVVCVRGTLCVSRCVLDLC